MNKQETLVRKLKGLALADIVQLEGAPYWTLTFEDASCHLSCFWRLLKENNVALSVTDEGQFFGLGKPFSIRQYFRDRVFGQKIIDITIGTPIADLRINLSGGFIVEAFIDSGGYEGWSLSTSGIHLQSLGGGNILVE